MSVITSLKNTATSLAQKALQLGGDFVHPVSDDSGEGPDYAAPSGAGQLDVTGLPHSHTWGEDRPTTTYIDQQTGLLTAYTEGIPPLDEGMTIYDLYAQRAERMGDDPLYTYKSGDAWVTKTATEVLEDIRVTAKGLMQRGLRKGDTVAFMCRTSYEWDVIDAAIMACGGVMATIYETDSAEQIRNIVDNSDARLLIVETVEMRNKADGTIAECPSLESILCLETGGLAEIQAYADQVSDEELDARIDSVKKTDLCSIVYTSGSTAAPKGVEMTHEHYCTTAMTLQSFMPAVLNNRNGSVLLFLPQAHTFARAVNYIVVASNLRIYIAQGIATLINDLQEAKPTVMIVVPRVLEKVYNAASQKAGHGVKGVAFAAGVVTAQNYMKEISANGKPKALTAARRATFDPMIYAQLRQVLGGRAQWIVAGGAPLDPELLAFFRGANIPVYEGYGLTETTAPCAFNPIGTPFKAGSVGIPYPGFHVRISEEGEIQIQGPAVFPRYHKNAEATTDTFTEDGWFKTRDLGRLDEEGFLYITGRKKDLIITAGGKNVSPGAMEASVMTSPVVGQCVVVGDRKPFIAAIITLDLGETNLWLTSQGAEPMPDLQTAARNPIVRAEVERAVNVANELVSRAESIRKFEIVPDEFTEANGLMTPSMKARRQAVTEHYRELIDTVIYAPAKR